MTDRQNAMCHGIIHAAATSAAAVGGGLAQLPGSDSPLLVAIQVMMIVSIGQVFDVNLKETGAKAMLSTKLSSMAGKQVARFAAQVLVGWIPGVGNLVNAATAAGITEAIGWILVGEFDKEARSTWETA